MARLSVISLLFAILGTNLVTAFNQTLELENSACDNNCWSDSFPGGSCTDDAACMCDQQKYREAYFCCMGKYCNSNVLPDSVTRQNRDCEARNMAFTFDSEAVCGVKLTTSAGVLVAATTAASSATSSATSAATATESVTTGDSESSSASASTTSAASSTITSKASTSGDQTASASATSTSPNAAAGREILSPAMILLGISALSLW
ncbi:unnamed protein product [Penicillium bialowiezense]